MQAAQNALIASATDDANRSLMNVSDLEAGRRAQASSQSSFKSAGGAGENRVPSSIITRKPEDDEDNMNL
jgi:hypothetical protein